MKKIAREDFWMLDADEVWNHVNALQTELDRLERVGSERKTMTVDALARDIRIFWEETFQERDPLDTDESIVIAKFIQPLTVQQGFVPDWSRAPEWAVGWRPLWERKGDLIHIDYCAGPFIPRPAPKTRERTRVEKIALIIEKNGDNGMLWEYNEQTIDYICQALNIPLTVTEE